MPPQNDPKQQQPQQPQSQQQPRATTASLDPYADPVAYVKANGFEPLGNSSWPNCLYIDKSRPMFAKEEIVPKMALFLEPDPKDPKKPARYVSRRVKQRVANAAGHVTEVEVSQVRHTPDQVPVFMQEALMICMQREHRKQVDAERERAKKEKERQAELAGV